MRRSADARRLTLDLERARAWLDSNDGEKHLAHEAPYQWVVTLFHELAFPSRDPRWQDGPLHALVYLSWESGEGNFLLRRAVPIELSLLELSQLRLAPEMREALESLKSGNLEYLDDDKTIRLAAREIRSKGSRPLRFLAVPVMHHAELHGLLLLVHAHEAEVPEEVRSSVLEVGRSIGGFSVNALSVREDRNRRLAEKSDAEQVATDHRYSQ